MERLRISSITSVLINTGLIIIFLTGGEMLDALGAFSHCFHLSIVLYLYSTQSNMVGSYMILFQQVGC